MNVKFTDNSDTFLNALKTQTKAALKACGMQAEGHCKVELTNTPQRVDTGLLRNSITHAISGETANISHYKGSPVHGDNPSTRRRGIVGKPAPPPHEGTYSGQAPEEGNGKLAVWIGTNVEYAVYVHDGTSKMTANRFIRNGITKYANEYREIIKKYLK